MATDALRVVLPKDQHWPESPDARVDDLDMEKFGNLRTFVTGARMFKQVTCFLPFLPSLHMLTSLDV